MQLDDAFFDRVAAEVKQAVEEKKDSFEELLKQRVEEAVKEMEEEKDYLAKRTHEAHNNKLEAMGKVISGLKRALEVSG